MRTIFTIIMVLVFLPLAARADVKLPNLLSNNMVLQEGMEISLWGIASPGEKVAVTLAGQKAETAADDKGRWSCKLPAMNASSKPVEMTVQGKNTLTVKNILIGEVWYCAGQSNMGWPLKLAKNGEEEIKSANFPELRYFVNRGTKDADMPDDMRGSWLVCTPSNADRYSFSAVPYFFGRKLHQELKRPVGVIAKGIGGSFIEEWISEETFNTDPALADFPAVIAADKEAVAKMEEDYNKRLKDWEAAARAVTATRPDAKEGKGLPYPPKRFRTPEQFYSVLYNNSMPALKHLAIKGITWYQGESQENHAEALSREFPALINSFRKDFNRPELPFLFVQLPNLHDPDRNPNARASWAQLREAQAAALKLPNTLMVVTLDVGEAKNVHPPDKAPVSDRLVMGALATVYKVETVKPYASPLMDSVTIDGGKVTVKFKHAEGGLMTTDGAAPRAFAVAGADGKYFWADAAIEKDAVMLTCKDVASPKSVRYAFSQNPQVNLVNKSGLPAAPFRWGEAAEKSPPPYSAWKTSLRG